MAKLSYKVSYYVLYVMFAAILVVLGLFYFGGDAQGDAVLMSVDSEMWQPAQTDALLYLDVRFVWYSCRCYSGCFPVPIWDCLER